MDYANGYENNVGPSEMHDTGFRMMRLSIGSRAVPAAIAMLGAFSATPSAVRKLHVKTRASRPPQSELKPIRNASLRFLSRFIAIVSTIAAVTCLLCVVGCT